MQFPVLYFALLPLNSPLPLFYCLFFISFLFRLKKFRKACKFRKRIEIGIKKLPLISIFFKIRGEGYSAVVNLCILYISKEMHKISCYRKFNIFKIGKGYLKTKEGLRRYTKSQRKRYKKREGKRMTQRNYLWSSCKQVYHCLQIHNFISLQHIFSHIQIFR